jgi:8-oxo-dGTP pyrophosphatase MutT (NUDIX family)
VTQPGVHASAVAALADWRPPDHGQDSLRHAFLSYLAARPDACQRECVPGHLTASMLLVDDTGEHALLTLHPRVGRWLQLGGHCEPADATIGEAALREGIEESGIDGIAIDPVLLHLAVYPITCSLGVPTRHFDVHFLGVAPPGAVARTSDESLDLRWWPLAALETVPLMAPDVPIMAALAGRRLASRQTVNATGATLLSGSEQIATLTSPGSPGG